MAPSQSGLTTPLAHSTSPPPRGLFHVSRPACIDNHPLSPPRAGFFMSAGW